MDHWIEVGELGMSLLEVARAVRAGWRTMLLAVLGALAGAVVLTLLATPSYVAHARVYLTVSHPANETTGDPGGLTIVQSADLETLVDQLDSPIVQEPLARATAAPAGATFTSTVTVPETHAWIDIVGTSNDPQVAAQGANAVGPVLARAAAQFAPLLSQPSTDITSTTITPAVPPATPSSPEPRRNIVLGLLFGLAGGTAVILARRSTDTRVHTSADLSPVSSVPVLATVPDDPIAARATLAFEASPHGVFAESIRRLRTNLVFVDATTTTHSFVLTSPMPGEGKTTTIVNLARALAETGARTLVVDADLRNPSVAKALGIEGGVGLTTLLVGRASLRDAIQPWGETSLDVLPAGEIPPNPTELLGSARMAQLVTRLSADYDFVLLDSPPLVPVVDAVLLQRLTGALVLVVAAERTQRKELTAALHALHTVGAEPSGFVLNFVPPDGVAYRYGYPYGRSRSARSQGGRARRRVGAGA